MENKENNQDDLVVSSTGEMLTKEESENRQIEVKEAPQNTDVAEESTDVPPSESETTKTPKESPTGLVPPAMPTTVEAETSQASNESSSQVKSPPVENTEKKQPKMAHEDTATKNDSGLTDEEFAKRHSNHERSSGSNHHTRNNKKVLAILIIVGAMVLSGLAVFVYLATQENVVEAPTTNNTLEQNQNGLIEQRNPVETNSTEDETTREDTSELPIDDSETIENPTLDEEQPVEDGQTESLDPVVEPTELNQ